MIFLQVCVKTFVTMFPKQFDLMLCLVTVCNNYLFNFSRVEIYLKKSMGML